MDQEPGAPLHASDEERRGFARRLARRMEGRRNREIHHLFDLARRTPDLIDLSLGQPPGGLPQSVREAAALALVEEDGRYSPPEGLPTFLEALSRHLEQVHGVTGGALMATGGITAGFHLACEALFQDGDDVLVPDPGFVAHTQLVELSGANPVRFDTYPDFRITREAIEAAVTPRSKAIVVCNPGIPGGVVSPRSEIEAVVRLARELGLFLLADEAYGELVYDGAHVCLKRFDPDALLFGGFSKAYGIAGWRLGFVHGPPDVIEKLRSLQQCVFTCAPTFAQRTMVHALRSGNEEIRRGLAAGRDLTVGMLGDILETPPAAGQFAFFPAPWGTASEFSQRCLEKGLVIVPGRFFSERDTHCRLAFSVDLPELERGLDILRTVAREGPGP